MQKENYHPNIELGTDVKTKEKVVFSGVDRTQNTLMMSSVGNGTVQVCLSMIKQDIEHLTRYINDYSKLYDRKDFLTENVAGRYLNGISVIEDSNIMCEKIVPLLKAHGITEDAITIINPLDPNTASFNPLQGPYYRVARNFVQIIEHLYGPKGKAYFGDKQKIHLKHYIYLLTMHDPNQEATLDMLLEMYNNPQFVRELHLKLKENIPSDLHTGTIEDVFERDYWTTVENVNEWFDLNLLPQINNEAQLEFDYTGEPLYYDQNANDVLGIRIILNKLSSNPLIRRVLFGKSTFDLSNFDFDQHMSTGGILLVNTAKEQLGEFSEVLGRLVLMELDSAAHRRPHHDSSFHHIFIDRVSNYIYKDFLDLLAQSDISKVMITMLDQTASKLKRVLGEDYTSTLIDLTANHMVYGDISDFDRKFFFVIEEDSDFDKKFYFESEHDTCLSKPFSGIVKIGRNGLPLQIDSNFFIEDTNSKENSFIRVNEDNFNLWNGSRHMKYLLIKRDNMSLITS